MRDESALTVYIEAVCQESDEKEIGRNNIRPADALVSLRRAEGHRPGHSDLPKIAIKFFRWGGARFGLAVPLFL